MALLVLSEDAISLHVESRKFLIVQEFMKVLPRPSQELAMAGESAEPIERWTANVVTMCCDCKVFGTGPQWIESQAQSFVDFAIGGVTARGGPLLRAD